MSVQDNWSAHLRAIVDAEAPGKNKRPGYRAVAVATGLNVEYVYQLYKGIKRVGIDSARTIGRAFANGRDSSWFDQPLGSVISSVVNGGFDAPVLQAPTLQLVSPPPRLEDQGPRSLLDTLTVVQALNWGDLMGALPESFTVQIEDDAMAPEVRKGTVVHFTCGIQPTPGDGLLVRDETGVVYYREYRVGRGKKWIAFALNEACASFDSEADILEILAVETGVLRRRSQR